MDGASKLSNLGVHIESIDSFKWTLVNSFSPVDVRKQLAVAAPKLCGIVQIFRSGELRFAVF